MAVELALRTSVLVDVGQYWWTVDGLATAQTAQRWPRNDLGLHRAGTHSALMASRRVGSALPGRARVVKVERPTGRTT
jgi:hypothetical protein